MQAAASRSSERGRAVLISQFSLAVDTTGADPSFVQENLSLLIDFALRLVGVAALLFVGFLIANWAGRVMTRSLQRSKLDLTLAKFFGRAARWGVLLLVALTALSLFGIQTSSFAVVLGAAGLAIGLAFQGTLSNFASGVMLLIFRPFKVGDAVAVAGVKGVIDEIQLFTTTLDTFDNRRFIIPNSSIFGSTIENMSHHDTRRVEVSVGTDYAADLGKTRSVLEEVARSVEGALETPESAVMLDSLGDSCINWSVRVWTRTSDFFAVRQALTRDIKNELDSAGVGIPYPQMDVHMDKANAS